MKLAVWNINGPTLIKSYDILGALLTGNYSVTLPTDGSYYYVAVTGVGDATSLYTSYASLGAYKVTVDFPTPGVPAPLEGPNLPPPSPTAVTQITNGAVNQKTTTTTTGKGKNKVTTTTTAYYYASATIVVTNDTVPFTTPSLVYTWSSSTGAFPITTGTTPVDSTGSVTLTSPGMSSGGTAVTLQIKGIKTWQCLPFVWDPTAATNTQTWVV